MTSGLMVDRRSNEDGLPSAAIGFAVDHGVSRDGAPSNEEGSPMECYVGLDVHSKASVFVLRLPVPWPSVLRPAIAPRNGTAASATSRSLEDRREDRRLHRRSSARDRVAQRGTPPSRTSSTPAFPKHEAKAIFGSRERRNLQPLLHRHRNQQRAALPAVTLYKHQFAAESTVAPIAEHRHRKRTTPETFTHTPAVHTYLVRSGSRIVRAILLGNCRCPRQESNLRPPA